jgi:hypothetical protein
MDSIPQKKKSYSHMGTYDFTKHFGGKSGCRALQVIPMVSSLVPISMDWFKGKPTGNHRFSH